MRIDSTTFTLPAQKAGGQLSGKPLEVGDSVKGEVLFSSGDKANIKLDNGVLLRNVQLDGVKLAEGDTLKLTVSEMQQGQMTLKVEEHTGQGGQTNTEIPAADVLKGMGVEANARNVELASIFMSKGLPMTSDSLQSAASLMDAFPNLSPEQAVFLAANGITDPKLVEAFAQIVNEGSLTGGQLMELAKMIEQEAGAALAGGDPGTNALLQNADQTAQAALTKAFAGMETTIQGEGAPANTAAQNAGVQIPQQAAMEELALISPETAKLVENAGAQSEAAKALSGMIQNPQDAAKIANEFVSANFPELSESAKDAAALSLQRAAPLLALSADADETTNLAALKPGADYAPQIERLLADIESVFARVGENAGEDGGKALQKLATRLEENLSALRAQIEASDMPGKEALLNKLDQTIAQTKLSNDIQQYAFVQIPVQLGEHRTTAELYVMKRKHGKKAIDPEDVTVVVALDTQNMGRVESVVKVERKSVALHAKVSEEPVAAHMRTGSAKLHSLLTDVGYRLSDFNARLQENKVTPLNVENRMEREYKPLQAMDFRI